MSTEPGIDGPSPRAVALARASLYLVGSVWLLAGIAVLISWSSEVFWGSIALVAFGLLHFVVARFGSRRIAVFFARLGVGGI
jgi:hypothetical protein